MVSYLPFFWEKYQDQHSNVKLSRNFRDVLSSSKQGSTTHTSYYGVIVLPGDAAEYGYQYQGPANLSHHDQYAKALMNEAYWERINNINTNNDKPNKNKNPNKNINDPDGDDTVADVETILQQPTPTPTQTPTPRKPKTASTSTAVVHITNNLPSEESNDSNTNRQPQQQRDKITTSSSSSSTSSSSSSSSRHGSPSTFWNRESSHSWTIAVISTFPFLAILYWP